MKKILLSSVLLLVSLEVNAAWGDCWIIPKSQCPHAELSGKNLNGANITGATLIGATLCNTVMPDGTVNNSSCTQ